MNEGVELPVVAAILVAILMIIGAAIALVGSFGLLRLQTFYERVHAPTLGTTLGTCAIAIASMIYFSTLGTRPVLHELLIVVFVTITTPITLMVLVPAAGFREKVEDQAASPGGLENERR
jgi:multicomponent K+:H+ antiporter subunit G